MTSLTKLHSLCWFVVHMRLNILWNPSWFWAMLVQVSHLGCSQFILAGLWQQIPVILFFLAIFLFLLFGMVGPTYLANCYRLSQNLNGPSICFLFHLFQVEWKTHMANFLKNCSSNSRIVCRLWPKVLKLYKKCVVWTDVKVIPLIFI